MPLAVQWWSTWYPGAEPGGGGYLAQRMLAAKDERNAVGAVLFFQIVHYAVRPWPWILVALASIVVYPTVADLQAAFPEASMIGEDSGYSAMLTILPQGWLGLILAISTHLNWGSSYVVNDFWKRFVQPDASERRLVWIGRLSTAVMTVMATAVAFSLENAAQAFNALVTIGAGTGGVLMARWYWWRVNAWSEIVAISAAALVMSLFLFVGPIKEFGKEIGSWALILQVALVTVSWITATFLTRPASDPVLFAFLQKTYPGGIGWRSVLERAREQGVNIEVPQRGRLGLQAVATLLGCFLVYGILFGCGELLFGKTAIGMSLLGCGAAAGAALWKLWGKVS
jgi:SSS family solute:Na+ symporter